MPRRRDAPNGLTAWLIVEAVSWARSQEFTRLSLNFSPFAGLLASHEELPGWRRLQRRALLRLKDLLALQLDNLLQFNGQFDPVWQPRYVILQAWADLPRVAVAAMAAEGYLPHSGRIRGRGWSRAADVVRPPEADSPVPAVPGPPWPEIITASRAASRLIPWRRAGHEDSWPVSPWPCSRRPRSATASISSTLRQASCPSCRCGTRLARCPLCSRAGAGSPASSPGSAGGRCILPRYALPRSRSCRPSRPAASGCSPCWYASAVAACPGRNC